jgi:hypothetical protein
MRALGPTLLELTHLASGAMAEPLSRVSLGCCWLAAGWLASWHGWLAGSYTVWGLALGSLKVDF